MLSFKNIVSLLRLMATVAPATAATEIYRAGIGMRDIMEEAEHFLVDNFGYNLGGLYDAVSPCSLSLDVELNGVPYGETNSGQWIRLPFHDFVNADVAAGTGGIDASIGFESDRDENAGRFVNDTLSFFTPDMNAYMSVADLIALAAIVAVDSCDPTQTSKIPLRAGRVDAIAAGPSGVPGVTTDLNTTLAQFESAGFNQSDTIALTACGHTVGHIHHSNFPDIVPESYVTENATNGPEGFDSTPNTFDVTLVTEYLEGTGKMGGPLVTASNVTKRSDYRLYSSDGNLSMTALSTDFDKCYGLFERMLNTVPTGVILSDVIHPMIWKVIKMIMDITTDGIVSVSGEIRYLYDGTSSENLTSVTYTYSNASGNSSTLTSGGIIGTGISQFGNTSYYDFNTTIESPGTTSLTIEGSISYPINDGIFVLPNWSLRNSTAGTIKVVAAVLTSLIETETMTGVLMVPETMQGTLSHTIVNTTINMTEFGTAGLYTLFEGEGTVWNTFFDTIIKVFLGDGGVSVSRPVKSSLFATTT